MSLSADDKGQILELLRRAAWAYDERKLDLLASCFCDESVFSIQIAGAEDLIGPFEGLDAIMGLYRGSLDVQTDVRRHVISNAFFTREEDGPVVVSNLTLFATEAGTAKLLCTGVYCDEVQLVDGRWCLHRRHLDLDSPY